MTVTSWIAECPYVVDVALMMEVNISQPLSCQVASPVMRYMYQTDSIASGLFSVSEGLRCGCEKAHVPEDVGPRSDTYKPRREGGLFDSRFYVLFV